MLKHEIVYIGSSQNMPNRIATHAANGRPFDRAFCINTTESEREPLEKLLIALIRPSGNRYIPRDISGAGRGTANDGNIDAIVASRIANLMLREGGVEAEDRATSEAMERLRREIDC